MMKIIANVFAALAVISIIGIMIFVPALTPIWHTILIISFLYLILFPVVTV